MNKQAIRQKIIDQQREAQEITADSWLIPRQAEAQMTELVRSKMIVVVMGIRRSGKSTLSLRCIGQQPFLYFNFDDEILAHISSDDLNELLEIGLSLNPQATHFLFDEIQNVENWELFINRLKRKKYQIIITGSNSRLLSAELATHLTGRHLSLELFLFSFTEYLWYKKMKIPDRDQLTTEDRAYLQNAFMHYMEGGGFPEVLSLSAQPKIMKQYVKELYEKIITRDIIQRRKIKNVKALREIAFLLTAQFAQQFTYQSVKKISTVKSVNTVKNYIEYLQESYLGFILEPYSHKIKERISLPKKYYIADVSIANAFCSDIGSDFGRKLENVVYIELRRQGLELYYAKKPQYEIDFLIRKGRAIVELIQVSWSIQDEQTRGRELKALIRGAKDLKCRNLKIITYSEEESLVYEGHSVQVIPIWKWLLTTPT